MSRRDEETRLTLRGRLLVAAVLFFVTLCFSDQILCLLAALLPLLIAPALLLILVGSWARRR